MCLRSQGSKEWSQESPSRVWLPSLTLSSHQMLPWSVEMHLDELFTSIINRTASPMHPRTRIYLKRMVSLMKHSVKTPISHNHPLHRAQSQHSRTVNRESGYVPPSRCGPAGWALMSLFLSVINHPTCLHKIHSPLLCSLSHMPSKLSCSRHILLNLPHWLIEKITGECDFSQITGCLNHLESISSDWDDNFIHIHNIIYIYIPESHSLTTRDSD